MLFVRKNLALQRQKRAARVNQIETGQVVVEGDLLSAEMLLHGHRKVGAALDGRIVGDDHHLAPADPADPGDDPRPRAGPVVHPIRRQRRQLQKGRRGIEHPLDPLPHREFAPCPAPRLGRLAAAGRGPGEPPFEFGDGGGVRLRKG